MTSFNTVHQLSLPIAVYDQQWLYLCMSKPAKCKCNKLLNSKYSKVTRWQLHNMYTKKTSLKQNGIIQIVFMKSEILLSETKSA